MKPAFEAMAYQAGTHPCPIYNGQGCLLYPLGLLKSGFLCGMPVVSHTIVIGSCLLMEMSLYPTHVPFGYLRFFCFLVFFYPLFP